MVPRSPFRLPCQQYSQLDQIFASIPGSSYVAFELRGSNRDEHARHRDPGIVPRHCRSFYPLALVQFLHCLDRGGIRHPDGKWQSFLIRTRSNSRRMESDTDKPIARSASAARALVLLLICCQWASKVSGAERCPAEGAERPEWGSGPGARSSWQSLCGCRRSPVCSVRTGRDHFGEFRVPTHAVAVASDVDDVAPVEQAASTRGPSTETPAPSQLVLQFELGLTYCAAKEFP